MATIFPLGGSESSADPVHSCTGVGHSGDVGIDLISSKYKANVVNAYTEF